jgi:hypothetical protein
MAHEPFPTSNIASIGLEEAKHSSAGELILGGVAIRETAVLPMPQNKIEELIDRDFADPALWSVDSNRVYVSIMGLGIIKDGAGDLKKVSKNTDMYWLANVYGAKVVPSEVADIGQTLDVKLTEIETVTDIHNSLSEGVLQGENIRVATLLTPPHPEKMFHPENVDMWLDEIRHGKWPIMRFKDGNRLVAFLHDAGTEHLGNMALFPREVQDLITEVTIHETRWRKQFKAFEVPSKFILLDIEKENDKDIWPIGSNSTLASTGVDKLDEFTGAGYYVDLLAYVVSGSEVSCEERLKNVIEYPTLRYGKSDEFKENASKGISEMYNGIGSLVNFNSRHRHGQNATKELVDHEYKKFLKGLLRIAKKIRG